MFKFFICVVACGAVMFVTSVILLLMAMFIGGWCLEKFSNRKNKNDKQCDELKGKEPVDVVEVIRCKDCNNSYIDIEGNRICKIDEYIGTMVMDNDYCSYGERKETK